MSYLHSRWPAHSTAYITGHSADSHRSRPDEPRRYLLSSTFLVVAGLLLGEVQAQTVDAAAPAPAPVSAEGAQTADTAAPVDETTDLGKVVVRARNRLEPLKDVPLSISVVTGKELERLEAKDIKEVLQRAGNVAWNQGNQRTSSLSIRGIGKIGQTEAQDPSVGVIVDGVNYAYNALTSSYDFTDVESLEVTRGPQGTLLGKNSSVGIINVTTRRPSFTPDANWALTYGQRDTLQARAAGGGTVIEDLLAWRGSISLSKGQGDVENAYNRDNTYTNKDRATGRVQFLLTPSENLSVRFIAEATPRAGEATNGRTIYTPNPTVYADGTPIPNGTLTNEKRLARRWFTQQSSYTVSGNYLYGGGNDSVNNDSARPLVTGNNGGSAEVNWHVGNFDLTSISAYRDYHFNAVNDEGSPFDVNRNSGGFFNDYKQWSQELRVNSRIGDWVDWQAGLFYLKVDNDALYQKVFGTDAGAWFASNNQYTVLDADGSGRDLLRNSLAGLSLAYSSPTGLQQIRNQSTAIFAQANWHISEPLTLTTGARLTREDRTNRGSSFIRDNGSGAALNPVEINGVQLGGFNSNASTGSIAGLSNSSEQIALANSVAKQYFDVDTYEALSDAQKLQVAAAKALRKTQIGSLFASQDAQPFKETQPSFVVSPSYKINDQVTTFVSWQYGEKPGIAQFVNGVSSRVEAEKTNDFELGIKTLLLNRTLTFNATVYLTNIKNYQQSVRVVDEYTTEQNQLNGSSEVAYVSATGNVPKVQSKGLEIDSVYVGLPFTTLRLSAAYNDARYKEFINSAQPNENGNKTGAESYRDVSGQTLAGAAKWTGNLGVDFRVPVSERFEFHSSLNAAYTSRFNSDVTLSSYSWIDANVITDLGIGVGRRDQKFDVTLVVKNALDDDTPLSKTWNSYTPAIPRWYYLQFTGKL